MAKLRRRDERPWLFLVPMEALGCDGHTRPHGRPLPADASTLGLSDLAHQLVWAKSGITTLGDFLFQQMAKYQLKMTPLWCLTQSSSMCKFNCYTVFSLLFCPGLPTSEKLLFGLAESKSIILVDII